MAYEDFEGIMRLGKVTMIGALPPLKGNAYYCLSLSNEMSRRMETEFISFKRLYPDFLYPGGVEEVDPEFSARETKTLSIRRLITYYNPFTWIWTGLVARAAVVHLQWWSLPLAPIYIVVLLILKARRKKIVFTVHNVVPHEKSILDYVLNKAVLSFGDALIVHSADNRSTLINYLSVPKEIVHVVHMPVHDMYGRKQIEISGIRKKLGLPQDGKIILSFGNIRPYKGIDCLIQAMPHVLKTIPDAHLLIAGQSWGNWEEPYGRLIRQTEIEEHVTTFLQYISMSKVAELFQAIDLVVLPYLHFDAQSGVGNIALAFELPMVVTDVGGLPELVNDERVVCEPGNIIQLSQQITAICLDRELYMKLCQDSAMLRRRYSWSAAVDQTVAIYQNLKEDDAT